MGSKTTIYLSIGLNKERPSYRRSLQLSKEAIQHFKTWTFKKISTFVGHFCPPGSGSGFRIRIHSPDWIRIQSGSNPDPDADPDPQPWIQQLEWMRIRNPALPHSAQMASRLSAWTASWCSRMAALLGNVSVQRKHLRNRKRLLKGRFQMSDTTFLCGSGSFLREISYGTQRNREISTCLRDTLKFTAIEHKNVKVIDKFRSSLSSQFYNL